MTVLGEVEVERQGECAAVIIRTTRRLWPWDVWTIVDNQKIDGSRYYGSDDLTYGRSGFRAVRGLQRYYIDDITYWGRKVGVRHRESAARSTAAHALRRFVTWRERQRAIAERIQREPSA